MPRSYGRWVHRDKVIEYLERYAAHHELDLMLDTEVRRLSRGPAGWVLDTSGGEIEAGSVVVATGYNNTPLMPEYPGRDGFSGDVVHASRYRNAEPYRGRDVLVVGSGNTGAEIAVDLVEGGARRVRLAVRTPPNIVRRQLLGTPNQVLAAGMRRLPAPLLGTRHQVLAVGMRRLPPRVVDTVVSGVQRVAVGDLSRHGLPRPERGVYTR